jgi:hypothetical protein
MADHLRSMPILLLPETYRDAIDVTRSLGVRYIWIDALCIIQSTTDQSDWESESSKMATIFENGLVTIAATSSSDCHGGLYLEQSNEGLFASMATGPLESSFQLAEKSYQLLIHALADPFVISKSPINERA